METDENRISVLILAQGLNMINVIQAVKGCLLYNCNNYSFKILAQGSQLLRVQLLHDPLKPQH